MSDILADKRESHRPVTTMMRVRLKADGRIVEIMPDGSERAIAIAAAPSHTNGNGEAAEEVATSDLRRTHVVPS